MSDQDYDTDVDYPDQKIVFPSLPHENPNTRIDSIYEETKIVDLSLVLRRTANNLSFDVMNTIDSTPLLWNWINLINARRR